MFEGNFKLLFFWFTEIVWKDIFIDSYLEPLHHTITFRIVSETMKHVTLIFDKVNYCNIYQGVSDIIVSNMK
jgi:hypothetical protein